MKKVSKTEAELKKSVAYKKNRVEFPRVECIFAIFSLLNVLRVISRKNRNKNGITPYQLGVCLPNTGNSLPLTH